MDFEQIHRDTTMGKLLRFPLKAIPTQMTIPILRGKLRGKKWIVGSGRHGCWLGTYEYNNQLIFEEWIKPGNVVFDIGAHVGFFTLLASSLVGSRGKVFAFEPLPRNLTYLREHLQLNQVKNVEVIEAAVSQLCGQTLLDQSVSGYQTQVSEAGTLLVTKVCLDELVESNQVPVPDYIKIDVEGHEKFVLKGAQSFLSQHHPTIFLSIHGRPVYQQCRQLLESLDYKIKVLAQEVNGQLPKNLDLIAYY